MQDFITIKTWPYSENYLYMNVCKVADTVSSQKYNPFKQMPSPSLNPKFLHRVFFRHVNALYWASAAWACFKLAFGLAPLSIVFRNMYPQNYYGFVLWPLPSFFFFARSGNVNLCTIKVALMPLGLVWTQQWLRGMERRCMHKKKLSIWAKAVFQLYLKVLGQKGGSFLGAYSTY